MHGMNRKETGAWTRKPLTLSFVCLVKMKGSNVVKAG